MDPLEGLLADFDVLVEGVGEASHGVIPGGRGAFSGDPLLCLREGEAVHPGDLLLDLVDSPVVDAGIGAAAGEKEARDLVIET